MSHLFDLEDKYCFNFYDKRGPVITHGKGSWIYDDNNNKYLDWSAQMGIVPLGHANNELIEALNEQANKISMTMMSLNSGPRALLAKKLIDLFGHDGRVYFANSGTESMEAALKFSRVITGRTEFISAEKSFHGRTFGSLSIMGQPHYVDPFLPGLAGCHKIRYGNIDDLKEKINSNTAAVILEPIQGEGGVKPASKEFLEQVREICTKNGTLLIFDEIQTGVGRTAKFFCFENYDVTPDIVCIAKMLSGGMIPIGACIVKREFSEKLEKGHHGSTFGSSPLACAVALKTIEIMERDKILEHAQKMGEYLFEEIAKINSKKIREIRGKGLMVGIVLKMKEANEILKALHKENIIALTAGPTVIRILPCLNISKEEMDFGLNALKKVLNS